MARASTAASAASSSSTAVLLRRKGFVSWWRAVAVFRGWSRCGSAPAASATTPLTRSAIFWCHVNSIKKPKWAFTCESLEPTTSGRSEQVSTPGGI